MKSHWGIKPTLPVPACSLVLCISLSLQYRSQPPPGLSPGLIFNKPGGDRALPPTLGCTTGTGQSGESRAPDQPRALSIWLHLNVYTVSLERQPSCSKCISHSESARWLCFPTPHLLALPAPTSGTRYCNRTWKIPGIASETLNTAELRQSHHGNPRIQPG